MDPLRKVSALADRAVVQFMLAASAGRTGEVVRILDEAAELAIRDGTESVSLAHLEHVAKVSSYFPAQKSDVTWIGLDSPRGRFLHERTHLAEGSKRWPKTQRPMSGEPR